MIVSIIPPSDATSASQVVENDATKAPAGIGSAFENVPSRKCVERRKLRGTEWGGVEAV